MILFPAEALIDGRLVSSPGLLEKLDLAFYEYNVMRLEQREAGHSNVVGI